MTKISNWKQQVNISYRQANNPSEDQKPIQSLKLHEIVKGLFDLKAQKPLTRNKKSLEKIHFLAEHQLNYYKCKKFSFLERFFSSLKNLFVFRQFHSSAYLAEKWSSQLLQEINQTELKRVSSEGLFKNIQRKMKREEIILKQDSTKPEEIIPVEKAVDPITSIKEEFINKETNPFQDIEVPKNKESDSVQPNKTHTVKEQFLEALNRAWSSQSSGVNFVSEVFKGMLQEADIVKWDKKNSSNFVIHLRKPLKGSFQIFSFELNKTIEFKILEEGNIKQVIFSTSRNVGLSGPLGTKLKSVKIEEGPEMATFNIEAPFLVPLPFGSEQVLTAKKALKELKKFKWHP